MAIADFAPVDRSVRVPLAPGLRAIVRWVAGRRAARAKRVALQSLVFAPEYRLHDIGITREQLIQAIEDPEPGLRGHRATSSISPPRF